MGEKENMCVPFNSDCAVCMHASHLWISWWLIYTEDNMRDSKLMNSLYIYEKLVLFFIKETCVSLTEINGKITLLIHLSQSVVMYDCTHYFP